MDGLIISVFLAVICAMMSFWRGRHFKHPIGQKRADANASYTMMASRYLNIYSALHLIGMILMFAFWIITWLLIPDPFSSTTFYMFIVIVPIIFILQIVCNLIWMNARYTEKWKLRWSAIISTLAMLLAAAFLYTQFFIHTFVNFPAMRWAFLVFAIIFSIWWIPELLFMWWGTGGRRTSNASGRSTATSY